MVIIHVDADDAIESTRSYTDCATVGSVSGLLTDHSAEILILLLRCRMLNVRRDILLRHRPCTALQSSATLVVCLHLRNDIHRVTDLLVTS